MRKENSFGILPLRKVKPNFWEILLIKHGSGYWAFPKGHPEKGESERQTAERELFEETRLRIKEFLDLPPISESYWFNWEGTAIHKTVVYFIALVEGDVIIEPNELSDYRWCSLEEAPELVTFPQAKRICLELILRFKS